MSTSQSGNASKGAHTPAIIGAVGAVSAALIGGIFLLIDNDTTAGGTDSPTASIGTKNTPDVIKTTQAPSVVASFPSVSPTENLATIPLALEDARKVESCAWSGNSGFSWKSTAPQLQRENFTRGFGCEFGADKSIMGELEFAIDGRASRFQSVAGVDTSSENTTLNVRFSVYDAISGNVLDTQDATIGSPVQFDVELENVNRLGLRTEYLSASDSLRDNSAIVSWAEPTLR